MLLSVIYPTADHAPSAPTGITQQTTATNWMAILGIPPFMCCKDDFCFVNSLINSCQQSSSHCWIINCLERKMCASTLLLQQLCCCCHCHGSFSKNNSFWVQWDAGSPFTKRPVNKRDYHELIYNQQWMDNPVFSGVFRNRSTTTYPLDIFPTCHVIRDQQKGKPIVHHAPM